MGTPGTASAPGAASTPGAATTSSNAAGASNTTTSPGAAGSAPAAADKPIGTLPDKTVQTGMPGWLADNLLVIVTAVLALVAFAIAWLLRRAGARRDDDDEDSYTYDEPALDTAALNRKLDTINLDLDVPPTDEPRRIGGPRV